MNHDHDTHDASEIDPQVSAHYQSLADEKTPPELDRAVMRQATRALQAATRSGAFGAWVRPVAFAATVGLSLAIVVELSDTGIFSPPSDMSQQTGAPDSGQSAVASDPDNGTKTRNAKVAADYLRREKFLPKQPSNTAASDEPGDEAAFADAAATTDSLTSEIDSAEQRLRKTAADVALQAAPAADVTAAKVRATAGQCTGEQRSVVDAWWQCIEELRRSGLATAARTELDGLKQQFPEFEPPE